MGGRLSKLLRRFVAPGVPEGFTGALETEENVLAAAEVRGGGHLVATSLGLWLPEEPARRVGWHLVSKATWGGGALAVIEAEERGEIAEAALLVDLPARRFVVLEPGTLPQVVHARVTGSIKSRHHRELPGGGAWFVQRKVPGRDGYRLQVRADEGTDERALRAVVSQVTKSMRQAGT